MKFIKCDWLGCKMEVETETPSSDMDGAWITLIRRDSSKDTKWDEEIHLCPEHGEQFDNNVGDDEISQN